jgi:hypothetical protein
MLSLKKDVTQTLGKRQAEDDYIDLCVTSFLRESMLPNLPLGGEWGFSSQAFA